ncbi:hypothetical protein JMY81_12300 [Brenneria goodwinii]|uniref:cag pathogenicity island Cag12 family protein n=1 Tax=Brenneria goodwinii TaxID=1109412 RepID=UPI0009081C8D|nr:hypothetical protein [Brenneria goodwinii]MCG8161608.1 hypothetical protein [Brenneria goodwinii]MCG8166045.1 hypothetical protein [Brenneria goodwinii]MCG8169255.1 hypothetical protein [Brenneria goodwinii]MCG8175741.1 hypothetical protein [Brenneria goodwinii]
MLKHFFEYRGANSVTEIKPPSNSRLSSIHTLNFNETLWTPAVFYAVAHSTRIVVAASSGADFFNVRNWLHQYGAKGVIENQPVSG